jgi:hypothetical protein
VSSSGAGKHAGRREIHHYRSSGQRWAGRKYNPGPVYIELDRKAGTGNAGLLDYHSRRARAEFHVLLSFPEFAMTLNELEADPELTRPLSAIVCSQGEILGDHSFVLSGRCDLGENALLPPAETEAFILPGT